jgi:adenosylcobinamide kinase / adenosylcobinamide-phosphate guanylyltransferase
MKRVTFVLGGARSGKSAYAESLAKAAKAPVYIATSEQTDKEMSDRIALHRERRGKRWRTIEEPLQLTAAIAICDHKGGFMLIDCITVWLNNLLFHKEDVDTHITILCQTLAEVKGEVVIVANEVGLGIVPDNALARRFRDVAGRVNQAIAQAADEVVFIAAGLPTLLKTPARRRRALQRKASRRSRRV